jgi:hypothetical protein
MPRYGTALARDEWNFFVEQSAREELQPWLMRVSIQKVPVTPHQQYR